MRRLVYPGYRFELRYRHSMYDVPVRERFAVDLAGRLVLEEIRSTHPDIVGYYDIRGGETVIAPGDVRIRGLALAHRGLRLRATSIGNRTYADRGCRLPLTAVAGESGALTLRVRLRPAAAVIWLWRDTACRHPSSRRP